MARGARQAGGMEQQRFRRKSFGATVEAAISGGDLGMDADYSSSISGLNLPDFFANAAGSALSPEDLRPAGGGGQSDFEKEDGAPMF